jgi:hypothetical protein
MSSDRRATQITAPVSCALMPSGLFSDDKTLEGILVRGTPEIGLFVVDIWWEFPYK